MSDRIMLELAEAREQRGTYWADRREFGPQEASERLTRRLKHLEAKTYGKGFADRCRAYMRKVEDEENKVSQ